MHFRAVSAVTSFAAAEQDTKTLFSRNSTSLLIDILQWTRTPMFMGRRTFLCVFFKNKKHKHARKSDMTTEFFSTI